MLFGIRVFAISAFLGSTQTGCSWLPIIHMRMQQQGLAAAKHPCFAHKRAAMFSCHAAGAKCSMLVNALLLVWVSSMLAVAALMTGLPAGVFGQEGTF